MLLSTAHFEARQGGAPAGGSRGRTTLTSRTTLDATLAQVGRRPAWMTHWLLGRRFVGRRRPASVLLPFTTRRPLRAQCRTRAWGGARRRLRPSRPRCGAPPRWAPAAPSARWCLASPTGLRILTGQRPGLDRRSAPEQTRAGTDGEPSVRDRTAHGEHAPHDGTWRPCSTVAQRCARDRATV